MFSLRSSRRSAIGKINYLPLDTSAVSSVLSVQPFLNQTPYSWCLCTAVRTDVDNDDLGALKGHQSKIQLG